MLTAEIRVNGALIAVVYARNVSGSNWVCEDGREPAYAYACVVHEMTDSMTDCKSFQVRHLRTDGWHSLVVKALKEYTKRKGKP